MITTECYDDNYSYGEQVNIDEDVLCSQKCNCGYISYESLLKFLPEIKSLSNKEGIDKAQVEAKLRSLIIGVSRLFDLAVGVESGHFSKAHNKSSKVIASSNNSYLKIDHFIPGTLTLKDQFGNVVPKTDYIYSKGYLRYKPYRVNNCGCKDTCGCGITPTYKSHNWKHSYYVATARFGYHCADDAVNLAITSYILNIYRTIDVAEVIANNFPINVKTEPPYEWRLAVEKLSAKKNSINNFAIA